MNHDPTPSSPADPPPNQSANPTSTASTIRRQRRRLGEASAEHSAHYGPPGSASSRPQQQRPPQLSKKAKEGLRKKFQFLLNLLFSLDTMIYAELCALYYMDCSFFRLSLRWGPQWLYLSPKSEKISLPARPNYPVSAIVTPNLLCMFLHIICSLPRASEVSRGYLHGGVLIDFVGQKAPTSKLSLIILDALVLALQCVMLAVRMEQDRIRRVLEETSSNEGEGRSQTATASTRGQDYDSEERGVMRDAPTLDETTDIEMRSLGGDDDHRREESTGPLARPAQTGDGTSYEELGDVLASGNAVLADLHVLEAMRAAWNDQLNSPERAAAYALQNVGYNATLAALAAQRRARLASGPTRPS